MPSTRDHRAGFTWGGASPTDTGKDHPRSRGVYMKLTDLDDDVYGSSPLARGLRFDPVPDGLDPGIIPARAGFTLC